MIEYYVSSDRKGCIFLYGDCDALDDILEEITARRGWAWTACTKAEMEAHLSGRADTRAIDISDSGDKWRELL